MTASRDGSVKVWDAVAGLEIVSLRVPGYVTCLAVSDDGRRIAAGSALDGVVKVWDAPTVKEVPEPR